MSILKAIYEGNYRPMEHLPEDPECLAANRAVCAQEEQLRRTLGEEDFAEVEKLVNLIAQAQMLENRRSYLAGFSAGMLLDREAREIARPWLEDDQGTAP